MKVELSAPVRPVFAIGPLERGAVGGDHEIARHREAESAGGGDAVDRGDERLRRAADLGNRAVDVFEDLLEALAELAARRRAPIAGAGSSFPPPRMNLRSAPLQNTAGYAAKDDGADRGVAGHLQAAGAGLRAVSTSSELNASRRSMVIVPTAPSTSSADRRHVMHRRESVDGPWSAARRSSCHGHTSAGLRRARAARSTESADDESQRG